VSVSGNGRRRVRNGKIKKYIVPNIPYLFILWFFLKLGTAYRIAAGANAYTKFIAMMKTVSTAFQDITPGLNAFDWLIGIPGAVLIRLYISYTQKNAKKFRKDIEYGSARWGLQS
jgi:type IV secretion system protein VirD4